MGYLVIEKNNGIVWAQSSSKRQAKKAVHVLCSQRGFRAHDFSIVKIVSESKCHVVDNVSQATQLTACIPEVQLDHVYMVQCDNDETWEDYRMETWPKVFKTKEAAIQAILKVQREYTIHPWNEIKPEGYHVDVVYHNYSRDERKNETYDTFTTACNMWIVEVPLI